MWVIILALLNKTGFKNLLSIPSMFILFGTIFSDSDSDSETFLTKLDQNILYAKLDANKFTDPDNNWENFFWVLIILAIIKRFININFKLLWIPFKIALIYYILNYFGYDFASIFSTLNTLSLGIIEWFYNKIIKFLNINKND